LRDLGKYENDYVNLDFEDIIVSYRRKEVISTIKKYSSQNILEVGCGMEPLFLFYDNFKSFSVVEPSKKFYENAFTFCNNKSNVKLFNETFEDFSVSNENSYDLIIISGLLHELEDPKSFLKYLKNFCKEDTIVHINVPNALSFHRLLAVEMGLIKDVYQLSDVQTKMQQFSTFNLDQIKNLVNDYGFKVLDSGSFFIKPFTHSQMNSIYKEKIINKNILNGLSKMQKYMPELGTEIYLNISL